MKNILTILVLGGMCILLLNPNVVFAQEYDESGGLVPRGCQAGCPCTLCDLYELAKNILNFLLYGISIPAAAAMFLWGGALMLTSSGSEEKIKQGRAILTNTVIGLGLAFFAWAIIGSLLTSLAFKISFGGASVEWFKSPSCASGSANSCNLELPPPPPPPPPDTGGGTTPGGTNDADASREQRIAFDLAGVRTNNANCPPTCLDGLNQGTVNGAISLSNACRAANSQCQITITGGTENTGIHSGGGPGSHVGGDKLDFRISGGLSDYINNSGNFQQAGQRGDGALLFTSSDYPGAVFAREGNHWDVCFQNC